MEDCWYEQPRARNSFSEILDQIDEIVQTANTSDELEVESFYLNIARPEKQAEAEEAERQRTRSTNSFCQL